jgi:hypothetical protein
MSFRVTNVCRPVQMPPTPKNVLMAIADYADDLGYAFPAISTLCTATCYGKTAVIEALKWLEDAGYLKITRTRGEHNRFTVNLARLAERSLSARVDSGAAEAHSAQPETHVRLPDQSGSRTGPVGEPVQQPDQSGSRTSPVRQADDNQSGSRTTPVRQADPNHHEPSVKHQDTPIVAVHPSRSPPPPPPAAEAAATTRGTRIRPDWLLPRAWGDWALAKYPHWTADIVRDVALKFHNHWKGKTGKDATKLDWYATWQNWCMSGITQRENPAPRVDGRGGMTSEQQFAASVAKGERIRAQRRAEAAGANALASPGPQGMEVIDV